MKKLINREITLAAGATQGKTVKVEFDDSVNIIKGMAFTKKSATTDDFDISFGDGANTFMTPTPYQLLEASSAVAPEDKFKSLDIKKSVGSYTIGITHGTIGGTQVVFVLSFEVE